MSRKMSKQTPERVLRLSDLGHQDRASTRDRRNLSVTPRIIVIACCS